jgi:[ribosomal protein S18]-alanine N-acetyltransferase
MLLAWAWRTTYVLSPLIMLSSVPSGCSCSKAWRNVGGTVDASLNPDLDDVEESYDGDSVLVAVDSGLVVGTGILMVRAPEGEIVRMAVQRAYRRRGIATRLLSELICLASERGINRIVVETNAKWSEARDLYEKAGFKFTHLAPSAFGDESFYELTF